MKHRVIGIAAISFVILVGVGFYTFSRSTPAQMKGAVSGSDVQFEILSDGKMLKAKDKQFFMKEMNELFPELRRDFSFTADNVRGVDFAFLRRDVLLVNGRRRIFPLELSEVNGKKAVELCRLMSAMTAAAMSVRNRDDVSRGSMERTLEKLADAVKIAQKMGVKTMALGSRAIVPTESLVSVRRDIYVRSKWAPPRAFYEGD